MTLKSQEGLLVGFHFGDAVGIGHLTDSKSATLKRPVSACFLPPKIGREELRVESSPVEAVASRLLDHV